MVTAGLARSGSVAILGAFAPKGRPGGTRGARKKAVGALFGFD